MSGYVVIGAVLLAGILLVLAAGLARALLAPRRPTTGPAVTTYESGVDPVGEGWAQSNVRYLAYAFLYLVFAVDAVYLFPWAGVIRTPGLATASIVEMAIFASVIVVGLAHVARRGLLRWW